MSLDFPPGLILIAAAAVLPLLSGRWLVGFALVAAFSTLAATLAVCLGDPAPLTAAFLPGFELHLLQLNAPTRAFALIFALMACFGTVYALARRHRGELAGAFLYAGSAICATFAGDLLTVFIYWELMALGSTLIVWTGGMADSGPAGRRYVSIHLLGGVLLLGGIAAWASSGGSLLIPPDPLDSDLVRSLARLDSPAAWLMLIGILINAGAPPLGAWVADAYPEASPSGTVFLSAFTTKLAVFALMMLFAGTTLLVWIGLAMAVYGLVYALMETDIRRILAYTIINQVGFLICAIGLGSELALAGATAHAFSHIIYKALLLMAAGSVVAMTGRRMVSELGGLHRSMPITLWCGIIGALAISAVPLTSSFATKSLITTAAGEAGDVFGGFLSYPLIAWFGWISVLASILLQACIKFPWFVFVHQDCGLRPGDPPLAMRAAMIGLAGLCVGVGIWPDPLYAILPYAPMILDQEGVQRAFVAYTTDLVTSQLTYLVLAGLGFVLLLPWLRRTRPIGIDGDWLWRRLLPLLWRQAIGPALAVLGRGHGWVTGRLPGLVAAGLQRWRHRVVLNQDIGMGEVQARVRVLLVFDRGRRWAVGGVLAVMVGVLALYLLLLLT